MNKIDAKVTNDEFIKDYLAIFVDDTPLDIFLSQYTKDEYYKGLLPAWLSLDNENEQKYVWEILNTESSTGLSLPILLCPEDMDFSCTTIVSKVFCTHDEVIWDRIGIIKKENWDIKEWQKSGIRNIENWSEEEWKRYGDYFDVFDLRDSLWDKWISENWQEEEFRRIHNYVHQYMNKEENIQWFDSVPKLVFGKEEYQRCIKKFSEQLSA